MAKKDKEQLEAEKKLKAAEKSAPKKESKAKKDKKPRRRGRFKKFRAETKKITWPDGKTVLKSTGIVIVCIIVVGSLIWIIDWGLGFGLGQTLQFAAGREPGQGRDVPGDIDLGYGLDGYDTTPPPIETTAAPEEQTEAPAGEYDEYDENGDEYPEEPTE